MRYYILCIEGEYPQEPKWKIFEVFAVSKDQAKEKLLNSLKENKNYKTMHIIEIQEDSYSIQVR